MESLLHFLNNQSSGPYTDNENKKIAEYLTGKRDFKDIKPFLRQSPYLIDVSGAREIGRAVAGNKELLPRLGRFLRLARNITNITDYFDFVTYLSAGGLTVEEMYVDGGLGADTLLVDQLYRLSASGYQNIVPGVLGAQNYPEFFDTVYQKYPAVFRELIERGDDLGNHIFCGFYLYTRYPTLNEKYFCIKNIPKTASKSIAWTEFESLPKVRIAGTETYADDLIVTGYIYLLVTQTAMALPPSAVQIRSGLNKDDLCALGEHLYHIWKKNGAVAKQRGVLVTEVLGDRIVPNLGFDSRGEQIIDYGSRSFTATINPSLQIELKTADGKAIKSLPAPGANDDQAKAAAAKEAFSAQKKRLKSVASIQCLRLELALSNNRTWTKDEWTKLFVENPIMNMFAIGLIWGTYDTGGKLLNSFRYMEDGTFTNVDEDEVTLAPDAAVGLCHPLDLGDELIGRWKQQLADYEIRQPVEQLSRKVFRLDGEKKVADSVTEFGGAVMYAVSLLGKLKKLGWRNGSVQDAGSYNNFYKEDKKQGIGVWLNFSGSYMGVDATEEVTVYDAVFYKAGKVEYGSYVYDEVKPEDRLKLADIPPRLYSEVCYDIERATANRIRTDEGWEKTE
jgi:hypothetical protein